MNLIELRDAGLYCAAGDFWIDPCAPVERAVVTHAHSDHARPGSRAYLAACPGEGLLRARLGSDAAIETVEYGVAVRLGDARVSLHPAGHILGSAQVRVECRGEVWVVSGDYKPEADPTCTPLESLRCHTFVTESTFGLPVFRWPETAQVMAAIEGWRRRNREAGKASVLFAYALGKAQRLLAEMATAEGPVYTHGAVERMTELYRRAGVRMVETRPVAEVGERKDWSGALIVAPPSSMGSPWLRRFGSASAGFASGWMRIRGTRRRMALDRGFVISDHADWSGLLAAIDASSAETVWVTHGYRAPMVRWLQEHGRQALAVEGRYTGEAAEEVDEP